jgi:hypothetical protein
MYSAMISYVPSVNNACNTKLCICVLKWLNVFMGIAQMCYGQCYSAAKLLPSSYM